MKKKHFFWLLLFGIVLLATDTGLYIALSVIDSSKNLFYDRSAVSAERIAFWLQNSYDRQLGWNLPEAECNNLGTRRKTDYPLKAVYKLKTFGDSFTYGAEVRVNETWQAYIEAETGWDCLNYGVGAYGTDQALLKYEASNVPSEYAILGILCENIGRTASVYPAFYMREWTPPKPRFILHGDSLNLLPNPINSPDSAHLLLDRRFINWLKSRDYWPYYYEHILGAPARLQWPALYTVLGHLPFFVKRAYIEVKNFCCPDFESETESFKYYHLYKKPNEIFSVFTRLIDRFVEVSRKRHEQPVIVIFPDQFSLELIERYGRSPYRPLIEFLRRRGYDYLDFGARFVNEAYAEYYVSRNGHFSPKGNYRVAAAIIDLINELDGRRRMTNGNSLR